jgi:AraC-like DNA-binding protein/mannose-6-phosphate isomerase-like protein (cupin superfamily)
MPGGGETFDCRFAAGQLRNRNMKAILEQLPPGSATDVVACEVVRGIDYGCQWHFHPEVELLLTLKGGTHRWIGDNISPIKRGDLVLIGPNLPHDFRNVHAPGARFGHVHAIVLQFRMDFLGPEWLARNEMSRSLRLLQLSRHGIEITEQTRDEVARLMEQCTHCNGLRRLIFTLQILELLGSSRNIKRIASPGFAPEVQISDTIQMGKISHYIDSHISEPIYIKQLAKYIGMSEVSLSRYFKSRTGKTFPTYLNELRVARVCRLLAERDATIMEHAISCGFDSYANFEKQFVRFQGCSPRVYRKRALGLDIAIPRAT